MATPRSIATPRTTRRATRRPSGITLPTSELPSEDLEVKGTVVLDNGTGVIKAGLAGEDAPRVKVASIVGRRKASAASAEMQSDSNKLMDMNDTKLYLGDEAMAERADMVLTHPMEHGIVKDWDSMERLWDYIFAESLDVNIEEYNVLLTEPPLNPRANREKVAELMFEAFNVPGLFIGIQALLALYSEGLTTGMVLDIGDGVSHMVPVYHGYVVSNGIIRQNIAGRDLTDYMAVLLREKGYVYSTSAQREVVREIKEGLGFVSKHFDHDMALAQTDASDFAKALTLPDGQEIVLEDQRFRCAEVLFRPSLIGKEYDSLTDLVVKSLLKCEIDTRRALVNHVMLSGGSTMFPGLVDRLKVDLTSQLKGVSGILTRDLKLNAPVERQGCVWRGGSVLASLSTFTDMIVTWEDYDEHGPSIVNTKSMELGNL